MHIFYIHSHITYVIAQLFILEFKLDRNKVKFITSRSYTMKANEHGYDVTNLYNYLEQASKLSKIFKLKGKLIVLDEGITQLSDGNSFTAYLPQFNHSLFQIIATHKLCNNIVLVEEGITAYKQDKALYEPTKMGVSQYLSKMFSKRFLLHNSHYYPYPKEKFKFAICMSTDCFPFIDEKKVLNIDSKIVSNYKNTIANDDIVFVLDSFKERTNITEEDYLKIIKDTLNLNPSGNRLFVKFHPEQNEAIREKTISFIVQHFNFQDIICLGDHCILEFEFLKSNNLTVIGMHTSLLYYAKRFGHRVLSSVKITSKLPKINTYIDHIMDKEQREEFMSYE
ncbi:polysialyltransferase family glycosyltransferase [Formosa sp. 3Alg 14/1]|uniref:polysialyltransferase family glycosyltransferase n=1 Tax=Formosa sp. 3Alg 14/1 TaxID=3382190 RepID=UPI0039BDD327